MDEEAGRMLDEQSGVSASRFFYCAKASKSERNAGLEGFEDIQTGSFDGNADVNNTHRKIGANPDKPNQLRKNVHPTVKPIKLFEYLIKLCTTKDSIVLDPFLGSGTTAIACVNLGRRWIGIEKDAEYCKIAEARIKEYQNQSKLEIESKK